MRTTGRYEIHEVLGEGGMGVVYRAFDPVINRDVTLKTIRDLQDKTALELFKRECNVLASLAHPNIIEILDVGEVDEPGGKRPYFVMPLLRGVTLDQLIKNNSPQLTVERSIQMMVQVGRGLQAAHEQGLVHRDLKPSNMFVLEDYSVKVIDFGVAHLMSQGTKTGLKGTLLYMAPEQLAFKPPSPLSDQFSIAVVSYELLAHQHPFKVAGYKDVMRAILNHVPPLVSDLNPDANRAIGQVIHKALSKQPGNRFADVREFINALQKALRNEPIELFDARQIESRLARARGAITAGDLNFAAEILRDLEAEGSLEPEIASLRKKIEERLAAPPEPGHGALDERLVMAQKEETKRAEAAANIATIERDVEAEANLERKAALLEAAHRQYPEESRFGDWLDRVRFQADSVRSTAARAKSFAEGGRLSEAQAQWEIMRSTYPQYPGLTVEIQRLEALLNKQREAEARKQQIAQIEQALRVGDWAGAASLAKAGLAEVPDDTQLLRLDRQAHAGLEKAEQAKATLARNAATDALLKQARGLLDSDWRRADALVTEAQRSEPASTLAKSLRTLINEKKEAEHIKLALSKARERQALGDVPSAIAYLDRALEFYPGNERLLHLRGSLMASLPQPAKQELRNNDLLELNRLLERSRVAEDPKEIESISASTKIYTTHYGDDHAFQPAVTGIQKNTQQRREATQPQNRPAAAPFPPAMQPQPVQAAPIAVAAPKTSVAQVARKYPPWWGKAARGAAAVLLVAAVLAMKFPARRTPVVVATGPTFARLRLDQTTENARVTDSKGVDVTGRLPSGLPAGRYTLSDSKPGFQALAMSFEIDPARKSDELVVADWRPLPALLTIKPTSSGTWRLDGKELAPQQSEKIVIPDDGDHVLSWSNGTSEAKLPFQVKAGRVDLGEWQSSGQPGETAVAASFDRDGGYVRKLNFTKVSVKMGTREQQEMESDGPVALPAPGEDVVLKAGRETWKPVEQTDVSRAPVIAVYLAPAAKASQPASIRHRMNKDAQMRSLTATPPVNREEAKRKAREALLKTLGRNPDVVEGKKQ